MVGSGATHHNLGLLKRVEKENKMEIIKSIKLFWDGLWGCPHRSECKYASDSLYCTSALDCEHCGACRDWETRKDAHLESFDRETKTDTGVRQGEPGQKGSIV